MTTIPVIFKFEDQTDRLPIDTNITIEKMKEQYLTMKNLLNNNKKYSFLVNSTLLNKKNAKKLIKHFPKIKARCTIIVREVGQIDGGKLL